MPPLPFVPEPYDYGPTSRIAEMMLRSGQMQADARYQNAQALGQGVANLGQTIGGVLDQRQAQQQQAAQAQEMGKRDGAWMAYLRSGEWQADPQGAMLKAREIWGPVEGPKQFAALSDVMKIGKGNPAEDEKRFQNLARRVLKMGDPAVAEVYPVLSSLARKAFPEAQIPEQYDPQIRPMLEAFAGEDDPEEYTLSPGQRRMRGDQVVAQGAVEPPRMEPRVVGRSLVDPTGRVIYRDPESQASGSRTWVMREGRPVRVAEGEIQQGDTPYESARSDVKKMPAGTASRIGEINTSIGEAGKLRAKLGAPGGTGIMARAGAMAPDVITETTGIGADAKSRQATILLVKQIIGKGLEGGVLRKEDESKYAHILPTIGDAPEVAASKIDQLIETLNARRTSELEALADAGYDTTAFESRQESNPPKRLKYNRATGRLE